MDGVDMAQSLEVGLKTLVQVSVNACVDIYTLRVRIRQHLESFGESYRSVTDNGQDLIVRYGAPESPMKEFLIPVSQEYLATLPMSARP